MGLFPVLRRACTCPCLRRARPRHTLVLSAPDGADTGSDCVCVCVRIYLHTQCLSSAADEVVQEGVGVSLGRGWL